MEYTSCRYIESGLSFFKEKITFCNHNYTLGTEALNHYKGEYINFEIINNQRLKIISDLKQGIIPIECNNCFNLEFKNWNEEHKICFIDFNYWEHCNCGCVYCGNRIGDRLNSKVRKSDYYEAYPVLQDIVKAKLLGENCEIFFCGGEIAVLKEFPKMVELLLKQNIKEIHFLSSGIKTIPAVEKALKKGKASIGISIDSGTKETYKQIKRIDAFDKVIKSIKHYLKAAQNPGLIQLKYILLDKINDNTEEIDAWLRLAKELGATNLELSIEFCRGIVDKKGEKIPQQFYELIDYAKTESAKLGISCIVINIAQTVLDRGYY